jgi:hypothetical protein
VAGKTVISRESSTSTYLVSLDNRVRVRIRGFRDVMNYEKPHKLIIIVRSKF